ncbi:MAG: Na+/H+ antiporter subunit E [Acetobacteraceae bacterium]
MSLIIALSVFWLLMSGHYTPFLLTIGLASVLFVTWITDRRMQVLDLEGHPTHLGLNAFTYWPWLLWEIVKAGWDVTKIILRPALPISPRMIRVPTTQATDLGKVIYANSITLTPGTISVELEDDEILVHALTRDTAEGLESGDMDRRCTAFEAAL